MASQLLPVPTIGCVLHLTNIERDRDIHHTLLLLQEGRWLVSTSEQWAKTEVLADRGLHRVEHQFFIPKIENKYKHFETKTEKEKIQYLLGETSPLCHISCKICIFLPHP